MARTNLSIDLLHRGDVAAAQEQVEAALDGAEGRWLHRGRAMSQLAEVQRARGQHERAAETLEQARRLGTD
jgi:Tfp pilus assembly protein PilF